MKVFKLLAINCIAFAIAATCVSCGSSKVQKVSSTQDSYNGRGVEDVLDECEQQSLDCPSDEIRAYASAVSEDRDFARQKALLLAKGVLSNNIKAIVSNVMDAVRKDRTYGGKTIHEGEFYQKVISQSENTISNCQIICSKRYRLSNGTYECTVCVSIPAEPIKEIITTDLQTTFSMDKEQSIEFADAGMIKRHKALINK